MNQAPSPLQSVILEDLVAKRRRLRVGYAAAARSVFGLPLVALTALLLTTALRCIDFDPLLGSPGYLLCPAACEGCTGPWRVVTHWSRNTKGGFSTKNGPQFFCPSPTNGIASLTPEQLKDRRDSFSGSELVMAPAAASYLAWLILLLPIVPFHVRHAVNAAKGEAAVLETEILEAAQEAGSQAPEPPLAPKSSVLMKPIGVVIASVFVALAVIGAEFALRAVF